MKMSKKEFNEWLIKNYNPNLTEDEKNFLNKHFKFFIYITPVTESKRFSVRRAKQEKCGGKPIFSTYLISDIDKFFHGLVEAYKALKTEKVFLNIEENKNEQKADK